ncbi:hypothetical protein D3C74_100400 [compost metagenome]
MMTWGKMRDWNSKRRQGKSEPTKAEGSQKAIVDMETWSKVQVIKKMNNESPVSQSNFKGEFILTGLLRCPVCGAGTVMSKRPKRNGTGYHLYYMCQNFHTKGKTVCSSNLINKELVEGQVLQFIRTILADDQIVDGIMNRLKSEESRSTAELEKDLNIQKTCLKKLIEKQKKQDADYYEEKIKAELYNRLSEALELELNECKRVIAHLEREIEKLQSAVIINKEIILEALMNFDNLFEDATNEEKRMLLRALIKEIHMEADRKSIKNIVFWFTEDDGNSAFNALPKQEEGRTVS